MRATAAGLVTLLLAAAPTAFAVGLGEITVGSSLNQHLEARIPVFAASGERPSGLRVGLAPDSEFRRLGIFRDPVVDDLVFRLERTQDGTVVRITSAAAIRSPAFEFVLAMRWPGGTLLRDYTVVLDPAAGFAGPAVPMPDRLGPVSPMPPGDTGGRRGEHTDRQAAALGERLRRARAHRAELARESAYLRMHLAELEDQVRYLAGTVFEPPVPAASPVEEHAPEAAPNPAVSSGSPSAAKGLRENPADGWQVLAWLAAGLAFAAAVAAWVLWRHRRRWSYRYFINALERS